MSSNQFAVIKTGGKQYKVSVGDVVAVEKIKGDHNVGDKIVFDEVLLLDDGKETTLGTPNISGKKVETEITEIGRHKKIDVVQYKAKSRHFIRKGHKQPFFRVKVTAIN